MKNVKKELKKGNYVLIDKRNMPEVFDSFIKSDALVYSTNFNNTNVLWLQIDLLSNEEIETLELEKEKLDKCRCGAIHSKLRKVNYRGQLCVGKTVDCAFCWSLEDKAYYDLRSDENKLKPVDLVNTGLTKAVTQLGIEYPGLLDIRSDLIDELFVELSKNNTFHEKEKESLLSIIDNFKSYYKHDKLAYALSTLLSLSDSLESFNDPLSVKNFFKDVLIASIQPENSKSDFTNYIETAIFHGDIIGPEMERFKNAFNSNLDELEKSRYLQETVDHLEDIQLEKENQIELLQDQILEYNNYIQEANDENKYADGWYPVCFEEFCDNDYKLIVNNRE